MKNARRSVGSADVARLAGVSRSAVSRAFTEGAYISPETRQKVLQAAEALNYQPNAIARTLSKNKSALIGVIATELENPFYAQLLALLSTNLQSRGYAVLLMVAQSGSLDTQIPLMLSYQVDGVILPAVSLSSRMAIALEQLGRPVVLINNYLREDLVSSVSSDNRGGGKMVGELLARSGYKRIAYIAGQLDTSSSRDRGEGLREGLAKYAQHIYAQEYGQYRYTEAAEAARKLLSLEPRPDAIFCANDVMAVAAMTVAQAEFNIAVPGELAVVGYDNSEQSSRPAYELTTVDQHLDEMARIAVDLLMSKVTTGDRSIEHRVVPSTLIVRKTTPHLPTAAAATGAL